MYVAIRLLLVAMLFLSTSLASTERYRSRSPRSLRLNNADRLSRVRKRQDEPVYFGQCSFVDLWEEELGYVIVAAFLDPAWHYSFRQAVMLQLLSSRLRRSGFPDVRFFVITPRSDSTGNKNDDDDNDDNDDDDDDDEDDLEVRAWREITAVYNTENLLNASEPFFKGDEMTFLRDDPRSRMWERFRASKDQVVIIDQCGKLTYHVMVPWSILHFPYVKAAILSTYRDDPCGGCDPATYRTSDNKDYFSSLINSTEEAEPRGTNGANPIWTAERTENVTVRRNESSEGIYGASTASSLFTVPYDGTTSGDTGHLNLTNATKFSTDETDPDNMGRARDREDAMSLENVVPNATILSRQEVSPKEPHVRILTNDHHDGIADGVEKDLKTSDDDAGDDEARSSEGNADIAIDGSAVKNGRNDSAGKSTAPEDNTGGPPAGSSALPLRIIMYAPHVHKSENGKMKKHVHLILKTDETDFHGHLDSGIDVVAPSIDSWRGAEVTNSKEHDRRLTEADADNDSVKQTVFDNDENPGLYGEVADWRSYEDSDIIDRNETFNDTHDKSTISLNEEHRTNVSDHVMNYSQSSEDYSTTNTNVTSPQSITELDENSSPKSISVKDQRDREEETRKKLIEHYSKLLAWIDYKINK